MKKKDRIGDETDWENLISNQEERMNLIFGSKGDKKGRQNRLKSRKDFPC